MWYQIFLYCLATTVLMHGLASLLAIKALQSHRYGRYLPIIIAVTGFLYPLTGGIVTSKMNSSLNEFIIYCNEFQSVTVGFTCLSVCSISLKI